MKNCLQFGIMCFAVCASSFAVSVAAAQERPLDGIRFDKEVRSKPIGKRYSYGRGHFKTDYFGDGRFSIQEVSFLAPRNGWTFGTGCKLETGDLVGLLGGVYCAECHDHYALLKLVPDKDLPGGVKAPQWDSITVPLTGGSGFNLTSLKVLTIDSSTGAASLELVHRSNEPKPRKIKNVNVGATVKPGDILLIRDKGHLVRAIVPPDRKTRVVGWVELSPDPIPEADLIRDNKVFVRPMPKDEKAN